MFNHLIDIIVEFRGVGGVGQVRQPLTDWNKLSPAGRVLRIHELRRDITKGKPFEVTRWWHDGKQEKTCLT